MGKYNAIQKISLLILGSLIALYVCAEIWFVTAFINSATLNEDLEKLVEYSSYAEQLAAFSITLNFVVFAVRKYQVIKDKFADWTFIVGCIFSCFLVLMTFHLMAVIVSAIMIGLPLLLKRLKVSHTFYVTFTFPFMFFFTFLIALFAIGRFQYDAYSSHSEDSILCHAASEFYKNEFYVPWNDESTFQKVEDYQIESLTFSILTCNSEERRMQIAQDEKFKAHMYKVYLENAGLDKLVEKYSELKAQMPTAFDIYDAYRKRPMKSTISAIIKRLIEDGYTSAEVDRFLSMIGIDVNFNARRVFKKRIVVLLNNARVNTNLIKDEHVFRYAMNNLLKHVHDKRIDVPFMASEELFKETIIEQTFEMRYTAFRQYNNFSHLITDNFFSEAKRQYLNGAPKELVLNLSVVTVILSLISLLFLFIEVFFGQQKKWALALNPITLTVTALVCASAYLPAPFPDPSGTPSNSTSIIKIHFYTYPLLKRAFINMGLEPWFDTYGDKPDLDKLEASIDESMKKKYYLTPINTSAVKKIQLLYFLSTDYGVDKEYDAELSQIEEFYLKIGNENKRKYLSEIKETYY